MSDRIKQLKIILVVVAVVIAIASLVVSHVLVRDLSRQERNNMEVWAEAMRSLSHADANTDLNLVLKVMNGNNHIPVIVLDEADNVIEYRNVEIDAPTAADSTAYLQRMAQRMVKKSNVIVVEVNTPDLVVPMQIRVCYDESIMLQRLKHYPYIQLGVISLFVVVAIFALLASKRAEQNKVWVGLSRETAHQLGTPISSLMAWSEVLRDTYPQDSMLEELSKDVARLQVIAERFSKIGSNPELRDEDLCALIARVVEYIGPRASNKVVLSCSYPDDVVTARICAPLFEWVIENLCKNAIDAMQGEGQIRIYMYRVSDAIHIEVSDTGKGIPKDKFKAVFRPGYTTKKRGWGLGLSLAKRIVEEYHGGRIYVKESSARGTTFCMELKK
ncbi:MAG: HAMP domain-containing histidine kinase [Bacteroidaceae bacterium]|jgi:nitrogen-specific signal transduction histidine kinase|nr:HAMP domain-containing histidine kinase [Bacteroidaceae bacterium]